MSEQMTKKIFDLFHRISEEDSAAIRKLIGELDLYEYVEFRNVGSGTRDIALLKEKTGNEKTPTLVLRGIYEQDFDKIKKILSNFKAGANEKK